MRGTTVAELGNMNRPLDMILYKKDGKDFLLMSNNSRGVMKISAAEIATAAPITTPVETPTGGVGYQTVASMQGIEQLDLLDAQNSIVIARTNGGASICRSCRCRESSRAARRGSSRTSGHRCGVQPCCLV